MNNKKTYQILKVVLIILMLILMVFILKFKTNDCAYCEFDLDGKEIGIGKFMENYQESCLEVEEPDFEFVGWPDE